MNCRWCGRGEGGRGAGCCNERTCPGEGVLLGERRRAFNANLQRNIKGRIARLISNAEEGNVSWIKEREKKRRGREGGREDGTGQERRRDRERQTDRGRGYWKRAGNRKITCMKEVICKQREAFPCTIYHLLSNCASATGHENMSKLYGLLKRHFTYCRRSLSWPVSQLNEAARHCSPERYMEVYF